MGDLGIWGEVARRNARSVQTLVGWIFWDPGALARYEALGLSGPLGYIAARAAPLAGAGPEAVAAAFGSISPLGIAIAFELVGSPARCLEFWRARDDAVMEGLAVHAPAAMAPLSNMATELWGAVDALNDVARPLFASTRAMARPLNAVLSGWHAVNCLREWRGDTHWAIVAAAGLSGPEASVLHNAWLGYDGDWLSLSRGNSAESIDEAWRSLATKGLAEDRRVTHDALVLRQRIEDETDRACAPTWARLGDEFALDFAERFEPPCEQLLARVDVTAGVNFQPASRRREPYTG